MPWPVPRDIAAGFEATDTELAAIATVAAQLVPVETEPKMLPVAVAEQEYTVY